VKKPVAAVYDRRPPAKETTGGHRPPLQPAASTWSTRSDGSPDFAKMTSEQRLAYHKARLNKKLGEGR